MVIVVLVIVAAIIIVVIIITVAIIIVVVILIVVDNGLVDGRMGMLDGRLNGRTDCVRRLRRFSLSSWEQKTVDVVSAKSRRAVVDLYMPPGGRR
jgi:hypothetical protein